MIIASSGPLLKLLSSQINASIEITALCVGVRSISYFVGSLLSYICRNRFDIHFILRLLLIGSIIGLYCIQIVTSIYAFCLCFIPVGLTIGFCYSNLNSLIFRLHDLNDVNPYIQGLHFALGLGLGGFALILGFIIQSVNEPVNVIFSILSLSAAPPLIALLFFDTPQAKEALKVLNEVAEDSNNNFKVTILSTIFSYMVFLSYATCGFFIAPYAINKTIINYSSRLASFLSSSFWLSCTIGRLFSIPLSIYFPALHIVYFSLILGGCGIIILLVANNFEIALWLGIILFGVCSGNLSPGIYTVAKIYIVVTPEINSFITIGASLGEVSGVLAVSNLFKLNIESIWYVCLFSFVGFVFCTLGYIFACTPLPEVKPTSVVQLSKITNN